MSDAEGTDRLETTLDAIEAALTVGDWDGARAIVAATPDDEPGVAAAGRAMLCTIGGEEDGRGDSAALLDHLARALRQRPGHPRLLSLLAAARALRGEAEAAEEPALAAVEADDSARSWETLGVVLGAAGKWDQAEQAYRKALERAPDRHTARIERARALGHLGLGDEMLDELAAALALDPDDHEPIDAVVQALVGDALAGHDADEPPEEDVVLADALELGLRLRSQEDERTERARVLLDLGLLRLAAAVTATDDAVAAARERVTGAARASSVEERVALASLLANVAQGESARDLLADLPAAGLADDVRARAAHTLGEAASDEGRDDEAVAHYEAALRADPTRWQSACNALQVLFGDEDGDTDRMAAILAAVDGRVRRAHPPLLYNEALYQLRVGADAEARALFEDVRRRVGDEHPLALYAQEALADLAEKARG